jgi:hypothetical protein
MSSPFTASAREEGADHREDLGAVQLDSAQASADRLRPGGADEAEPSDAEGLDGAGPLAGAGLERADVQGPRSISASYFSLRTGGRPRNAPIRARMTL